MARTLKDNSKTFEHLAKSLLGGAFASILEHAQQRDVAILVLLLQGLRAAGPGARKHTNLQLAHKLAEVVSLRGLHLLLHNRLQILELLHERLGPWLLFQSPLQSLDRLRSPLDLQHDGPGSRLSVLCRGLLLSLSLGLRLAGLLLFLLGLGLLVVRGRRRLGLLLGSLVALLGELSLVRLPGRLRVL